MSGDRQTSGAVEDQADETERQQKIETRLRREFRKLTPAAQEDDFVGLTLDLKDARANVRAHEAEIRRLKALVKSFEGDQAEVIRRQAQTICHKESEMYRANDKAAGALRQVYVLKKRVKELETIGIEI